MHNSLSLIPLWFYPIFIILVIWGVHLCKPCTVKPSRLIIIPLIFFLISTHHFMKAADISFLNIGSLIIGMGIGGYIGYLYKRDYPIKIDRVKRLIYLPTDKSILVLLLITVGVELFMSLTENLRPSPYWWFNPLAMIISGITTGIVAGGNMTHYYRYWHNEADSAVLKS